MKLGTVDNWTRDGALALADTNSGQAIVVSHIVGTMQEALDSWSKYSEPLHAEYRRLQEGKLSTTVPISELRWRAPLPRAYQLLDGGGYRPHLELGFSMRKQSFPEEMAENPSFYQSVSDSILGPTEDFILGTDELGTDFEAELVVVTDDVKQMATKAEGANGILLIGLMNDISLRLTQRVEHARGFGFYHCKPKKTLAPFLVTPDELGEHWINFKVSLPVEVKWNGEVFGSPDGAEHMMFDFATLVSEASRHRRLTAGTIIGGGTVATYDRDTFGQCCILERRALDILEFGEERTSWLKPDDRVRIEVRMPDGSTVFGAIDQVYRVTPWGH